MVRLVSFFIFPDLILLPARRRSGRSAESVVPAMIGRAGMAKGPWRPAAVPSQACSSIRSRIISATAIASRPAAHRPAAALPVRTAATKSRCSSSIAFIGFGSCSADEQLVEHMLLPIGTFVGRQSIDSKLAPKHVFARLDDRGLMRREIDRRTAARREDGHRPLLLEAHTRRRQIGRRSRWRMSAARWPCLRARRAPRCPAPARRPPCDFASDSTMSRSWIMMSSTTPMSVERNV